MEKHAEYAHIFKALSDETRLQIIEMLSCGEMCACSILEFFKITQPTLSYHMGILTECGLVNSRKDGSWMRYSLNTEKADELKVFLKEITEKKADCICEKAKAKDKTESCCCKGSKKD